jgi:hypothetical protein
MQATKAQQLIYLCKGEQLDVKKGRIEIGFKMIQKKRHNGRMLWMNKRSS